MLVGRGLRRLCLRSTVLQRGQHFAGTLCKGVGEALQGAVETAHQVLVSQGLAVLSGRPAGGHLRGLFADLRGCRFQRLAHGLLLAHGLSARLLPFGCERRRQGGHRALPFAQALLVGGHLGGLGLRSGVLLRHQHGSGALLEGMGEGLQGAIEPGQQLLLGVILGLQGRGPGVGHLAGGAFPLGAEAVELSLGGVDQALVGALRFLRDLAHGGLDHGLERLTGNASAGGEAVLQGRAHGLSQVGVGRGGFTVKGLLLGQQLGIELFAAALQAGHQSLQAIDEHRHGVGLGLQGLEGGVALMGAGQWAQGGGNVGVELAHDLDALTAAHGRHQAQQGGRGHAGHRGAEGQAQALDGCGQGGTDGFEVS